MFSSNQVLQISGELKEDILTNAIDYAMQYSDYKESFLSDDSNIIPSFRIFNDKYYIGYTFKKDNDRNDPWQKYPFDYDSAIISKIVIQYLEKLDSYNMNLGLDGSSYKGFLLRAINDQSACFHKSYRAIISIEPFVQYYAK